MFLGKFLTSATFLYKKHSHKRICTRWKKMLHWPDWTLRLQLSPFSQTRKKNYSAINTKNNAPPSERRASLYYHKSSLPKKLSLLCSIVVPNKKWQEFTKKFCFVAPMVTYWKLELKKELENSNKRIEKEEKKSFDWLNHGFLRIPL